MAERKTDLLSSILRHLPGFAGYVEQEERQASDEQARKWLSDRLQKIKSQLDQCTRQLVDQGKLDHLSSGERVRNKIDHLQARIRSTVQNYRSFLNSRRIDEDRLEDVYDCDAWLLTETEELGRKMEGIAADDSQLAGKLAGVEEQLNALGKKFDERESLLKSLAK